MDLFVCAKINVFLDIIKKRNDGYHEIETLFQTISIADRLTINRNHSFSFEVAGPYASLLEAESEENILVKIYRMFQREYRFRIPLRVRLEKRIPIGAGLGGGSADAAAFIQALNTLGRYNMSKAKMQRIAARFGADVPYFIKGGLQWGRGVGETLTPLGTPLKGYGILYYPSIPIATKKAYGHFSEHDGAKGNVTRVCDTLEKSKRLYDVRKYYYNSFEDVVKRAVPQMKEVTESLGNDLQTFTMLSGSGSSLFAVYPNRKSAERAYAALLRKYPRERLYLFRTL